MRGSKALKYKDESWITHIYNNVSVFYFNIRQLSEAEKYNELAIQHVSKTDDAYVNFSAWQLGAGIKAELNKIEKAEQFIRKAWQIACNAGENAASLKLRCMPSILRVFERQEQPDSVEHYLQMGNRLLADVPANSIPAIGFIQVRASSEMNRKNYAKALDDLLWLRNKNVGSEPKTLLTQIAQCYDATGNHQLAYAYMDSARMWTDTLAQHNLTQQMAEFNVKYQTQEKELQIAHLQQEKLEHETFLLKITVAAGCLLTLAFIVLLILYYKKRIADKKIKLLKQENELNSAKRYIEGLEAECKYFAKEMGTRYHAFAAECIALHQKLPASKKTLNAFVNDAIKYRMTPEQILYYSPNCFGTADAISFRKNFLRIHDLKTGVTRTHMEQLLIYTALFCLEYRVKPASISMELRIYQNDDVSIYVPEGDEINEICDKIIEFDKILNRIKLNQE